MSTKALRISILFASVILGFATSCLINDQFYTNPKIPGLFWICIIIGSLGIIGSNLMVLWKRGEF